jgi:cytoskeleton-associated protein 5
MNNDEVAVGAGSGGANTMLDEYGPAPGAAEEENVDGVPTSDLLRSKNAKHRRVAYERIAPGASADGASAGDTLDADAVDFLSQIATLIKAENQQVSLDALIEAAARGLSAAAQTSSGANVTGLIDGGLFGVVNSTAGTTGLHLVVEKGLSSPKSKVADAARAVIEVAARFGSGGAGRVVEVLTSASGASAKAPRTKLGAVTGLQHLLAPAAGIQFSGKPVAALVKVLLPLFNDTDGKIRAAVLQVAVECVRRDASVRAQMNTLRDVQQQDIDRLLSGDADGAAPAARPAGRPPAGAVPAAASNGPTPVATTALIDDTAEYSAATPTAVLSKLPPHIVDFMMSKETTLKWQERVEPIETKVLPLLVATVRASEGDDYTDLIKAFREFALDRQLPIMSLGLKCLREFSRILRGRAFHPYARLLLAGLFDKLKDKKLASQAASVLTPLLTIYRGATLEMCHPHIEAALASKAPVERAQCLLWLHAVLPTLPVSDVESFVRALAPHLVRASKDDKPEVRDALGSVMAACLERAGGAACRDVLDKVESRVAAKWLAGPDAAAPAPMSAGSSRSGTPFPVATPTASAAASRVAPQSRPVGAAAAAAVASTSTKGSAASADAEDEGVWLNEADYLQQLESSLRVAPEIMASLNDADWRVRAESWGALASAVIQIIPVGNGGEVLRALAGVCRAAKWKESNVSVNAGIIAVLQAALATCAGAARGVEPCVSLAIVNGLVPKFAETKLRAAVEATLQSLLGLSAPATVLRQVAAAAMALKSPKAFIEVCGWMEQVAQGPDAAVDPKSQLVLGRSLIEQPQPALRQAATKMLAAVCVRAGAKARNALNDVAVAQLNALDEEIIKRGGLPPDTAPVKRLAPGAAATGSRSLTGATASRATPASQQATPTKAGASGISRFGTPPPAGALAALGAATPLPRSSDSRADISKAVAPLVAEMTNGKDWRDRAAAVKKIEDLVTRHAGGQIQGLGVSELLKALRLRLDESSKILVVDVLRVMKVVVDAADTGSRFGAKQVFPNVAALLGDQKPQLRDGAMALCASILRLVGVEALVPDLLKPLSAESPNAKAAIVELLGGALADPAHLEAIRLRALHPLHPPVMRLMMDRSGDVRAGAADLFAAIVNNCHGVDALMTRTFSSMKPAEQMVLQPLIDRIAAGAHNAYHEQQQQQQQQQMAAQQQQQLQNHHHYDPMADPHYQQQHARSGAGQVSPQRAAMMGGAGRYTEGLTTPVGRAAVARGQSSPQHAPPPPPALRPPTVPEIILGLRSFDDNAAVAFCTDILNLCATGGDQLTEGLVTACFVRVKQTCAVDTQYFNAQLANSLLDAIGVCFSVAPFIESFQWEYIYDVYGHILDLLQSPCVCDPEHRTTIKFVNSVTLKILRNARPDAAFEATMRRLSRHVGEYLQEGQEDPQRLTEIIVRCLLRLQERDVSLDAIILNVHQFLQRFPPSHFDGFDDVSVRSIKQILHSACKKFPPDLIRERSLTLVGRSSLVTSFVHMCLESRYPVVQSEGAASAASSHHTPAAAAGGAAGGGTGTARYAPSSHESTFEEAEAAAEAERQQQQAAAACSPGAAAREAEAVAAMVMRARKHETTEQGIADLAAHLMEHPNCPHYRAQYERCTDAFRMYLDRRVSKAQQQILDAGVTHAHAH